MRCLLYTRDWIDLNKDFHYSDATWAPACFTSTYKKHPNFALLVRYLEEPLFTNGFPHKGSIIRKTFPWCDVSCRVLFNGMFISVFPCDVSDYELIESLCRGFTFKWDRSWVRTTLNIMVADVLTWMFCEWLVFTLGFWWYIHHNVIHYILVDFFKGSLIINIWNPTSSS